jgi:hypothetical protein
MYDLRALACQALKICDDFLSAFNSFFGFTEPFLMNEEYCLLRETRRFPHVFMRSLSNFVFPFQFSFHSS